VAVLAVFLFHLEAGWCPGGFAGVDVFFCVSGYVVAGSLLRRPAAAAAGPRRLLAGFYSRRAKRLGPALLLVAALTALAAALLVDPAQPALRSYFDTGLLGLVGLSNNLLTSLRAPSPLPDAHLEGRPPAASLEALEGNPYFSHLFSSEESGSGAPPPTGAGSPSAGGRGAPAPHTTASLGGDEVAAHEHHFNPFTHTWSLGVEEQFYLLFPLLFLLAYRPGAAARPSRRRPVVLFSGLTAAALVAGWVTEVFDSTHAFYLMPCRLWEMLCGSALLAGQDLLESGAGSFEGSVQAFEAQEGGGEGGDTPPSGAFPREAAGGGDEEEGPSEEDGIPAQNLASLPLWAVVAMDLGSAALIGTALALPSQGAIAARLLAVGGTLVFIAVGCRGYQRLGRVPVPVFNSLLAAPGPVYVGKISYPLYLWHWPVFTLFRWTVGLERGSQMAGACALSLAGAVLTYHTVELAARKWKPRRAWHVFAVFLPLTALAAIFLGLLRGPLYGRLYVRRPGAADDEPACPTTALGVYAERAREACGCHDCCPTLHASPSCFEKGSDLPACFESAAVERGARVGGAALFSGPTATMFQGEPSGQCFLLRKREAETGNGTLRGYSEPVRACLSPDRGRPAGPARLDVWPPPFDGLPELRGQVPTDSQGRQPVVFLVGDSHAASLAASLTQAAAGKFGFVWVAAQCGCSFGPRANWERLALPHCGDSTEADCATFNSAAETTLESNVQSGDVVAVLHGAWKLDDGLVAAIQAEGKMKRRMLGPGGNLTYTVSEAVLAREKAFLSSLGDAVGAKGAHLLLLGDWPLHPAPGVDCVREGTAGACEVSYRGGRRQWHAVAEMHVGLAEKHPSVHFLSLWDLMCDPAAHLCSARVPGTRALAFFDEDHLTVDGARYLAPHICSFLFGEGLLGYPAQ
tara:strand:+ start:70 stop:2820 length:2751 start_codon:yes stop_codon:yes gene_type:complete